MPEGRPRTGVVLLQLGGPDSLDAVEPFLYNLFCDPDIIDLPFAFLFRRPLARFISRRRAPFVQNIYRAIGGKSPIRKLTDHQAGALQRSLPPHARVYVAMRYWHPMTEEIVRRLQSERIERVVLLPLYPQYSKSTTGSSVNEWRRAERRVGASGWDTKVIDNYCDHPLYIAAIVRHLQVALQRVPAIDRSRVHVVFSAHGTPMSLVKAGDPYQAQIIRTRDAVVREARLDLPTTLCYQSKVGPQRWLEPSLTGTIARLGSEGVSHVVVVPIAFVSDHSETLYEINMEVRHAAHSAGIRYFDMSPALNTNPQFISCLAALVGEHLRA